MEKFETEMTESEVHIINGELATIFRLLSNPDALKILYRAGQGIENSTHTIEELDLTPKKYYYRLKELMAADLVKKVDSVYRQTAMGRIIYDRFLPAMGKTYDAREELELIVYLEGTELESGVRNRIEDELNLPYFERSTNMKIIESYESMVVDVIDLCNEAEESVLIASNYVDVRVMEATFRAVDRDVTNRIIMGKSSLPSKMQSLGMMFSLSFTKALINFASITRDLKDVVRFVELPYTFCVVDGHRSIMEISDTLKEGFIVAVLIDDRVVGERLTEFYNTLWETGDSQSAVNAISSIRSELNGEAPQHDSEL